MDTIKSYSKNLEAFEMWNYRRIMKVSWKEYRSKEEVLGMINSKRMLAEMMKRRELTNFGHLVRRDGIQRLLLDGKIKGKLSRSKQRLTWADNITEWRVYQGGTRPKEMEIHDSRPARSRWHRVMIN